MRQAFSPPGVMVRPSRSSHLGDFVALPVPGVQAKMLSVGRN